MKAQQKESYVQPELVKHELLRDITAGRSGQCNDFKFDLGNLWGHWFR
jgi:hypothetical protein